MFDKYNMISCYRPTKRLLHNFSTVFVTVFVISYEKKLFLNYKFKLNLHLIFLHNLYKLKSCYLQIM